MKGEVVKGVLKKHGVNIRKRCEVVRSSCDVVAKFIFAL